jgi:bifunctional DNA-binding transcriptional regulator/antitoxin component of YhaV-PrlF toxin-antitoxin module
MSLQATTPRQHLTTLTNGWRFTLPTSVRKAHGWDAGTKLLASIRGASLVFSTETQPDGPHTSTDGNLARDFDDEMLGPFECYLGSGGKIVLPVPLRRRLGWVVGKRLVIVDEGDVVSVTLCCDAKRCESCGSVSGVREIIHNVFLCSQCWGKYLREMHAKLRLGRARA